MTARPIRYCIERGSFEPPADRKTVIEGKVSTVEGNWGYADELLVASIMNDDDGDWGSVLLLSTENGGGMPSRKMLEMIQEQITHYLENHSE